MFYSKARVEDKIQFTPKLHNLHQKGCTEHKKKVKEMLDTIQYETTDIIKAILHITILEAGGKIVGCIVEEERATSRSKDQQETSGPNHSYFKLK